MIHFLSIVGLLLVAIGATVVTFVPLEELLEEASAFGGWGEKKDRVLPLVRQLRVRLGISLGLIILGTMCQILATW